MKEWFILIYLVVGFMFGVMFANRFHEREKIQAIQTSQENTVAIVDVAQKEKERVQNANEKCSDIFSIDIVECLH